MDSLDLELAFASFPVRLAGKEYTLREMNGEDADAATNDVISRLKTDGKTVSSVKDLRARFLSMCLFDQGTGQKVPMAHIRTWPTTVIAKLYKRGQQLNGMDDSEKSSAKADDLEPIVSMIETDRVNEALDSLKAIVEGLRRKDAEKEEADTKND